MCNRIADLFVGVILILNVSTTFVVPRRIAPHRSQGSRRAHSTYVHARPTLLVYQLHLFGHPECSGAVCVQVCFCHLPHGLGQLGTLMTCLRYLACNLQPALTGSPPRGCTPLRSGHLLFLS